MNLRKHSNVFKLSLLAALAVTAIGIFAIVFGAAAKDARRPLAMPVAAPITSTACSETTPGEWTCDLWANEGTVTLPDGVVVPVWGFAADGVSDGTVPGPVLVFNAGDNVTVNFTNEVAGEDISLSFSGVTGAPDLSGVATGVSTSYTFTAPAEGTYKYEAGMTPNGTRQVAMGLTGAMIVHPASGLQEVYSYAYDDEALVFVNELDPAFAADPNGFNMVEYAPTYGLINGKAYGDTDKIVVAPNDALLLRYVNGGLLEHSMGVLGLYQTWIGVDGLPRPFVHDFVAYTLGPGETVDTLVNIPADAVAFQNFPLYNTGLQQLSNNGETVKIGGAFTFIEVDASGDVKPITGPLADNAVISPDLTAGTTDVTLAVHFNSTDTSSMPVQNWEYFLNDLGPEGTGVQLSLAAPASLVTGTAVLTPTMLASLPHGDVNILFRGQDSAGTWGPVNSIILDLVKEGPIISNLSLANHPTNGSQPVTIHGTADDTPTGEINVVAAEYFINTPGTDGEGAAMILGDDDPFAPITSITADIDTATLLGLGHGTHTIHIHGQDELGNWGAYSTIELNVDLVGPGSSLFNLSPNPTNGQSGVNAASNGIRLEIDSTDPSTIADSEAFIDYVDGTANPDGSGFPLIASDALYNGSMERSYYDIPLSTIQNLSDGEHVIGFHALDAAGNWGDVITTALTVDLNGPRIEDVVLDPNPVTRLRQTDIRLSALAIDLFGTASGSQIAGAEWFIDTDPGFGNGTQMTAVDGLFDEASEEIESIFRMTLRRGEHMLFVRVIDSAGNWSNPSFVPFEINRGLLEFGETFDNNGFTNFLSVTGEVNLSTAAGVDGTMGMAAILNMGGPALVTGAAPDVPPAQTCLKTSFAFNTRYVELSGEGVDIFQAIDAQSSAEYGISYEDGPEGEELYIWVMQDGARVLSEGAHVQTGANHISVELVWDVEERAVALLLDGVEAISLTNLDLSDMVIEELNLGATAPVEEMLNMGGELFFDNFVAHPCQFYQYFPLINNGSN